MATDHRTALAKIKRFDQLIAYLRDEMGWPIARDSFEDDDDLFYDFTADELGIDPGTAAKIQEIKRLRPLSPRQPWGIFFVKFEPKRLPIVALRRILGQVALKKRASANSAERAAWAADDLLFVSNYGEGDERQISFAHFSTAADGHDLPTLRVLGWNNLDTELRLDAVARELSEHLAWPEDDSDIENWRKRWRAAFTLRPREVITTSKELSIRLAELARAIRDRIKATLTIETERGPLTKLMKAFQEALIHDLDADLFADMYAQTIAYGLLSARIADPHKNTADDFAGQMRTNPFLRELMETFLKVGGRRGKAGAPGIDFDELGVSEVVELLDDANMEAVVRDFGDRNPQEDPVIHFYELFLKEYDSKKRMQRGVFYTPRPVVSYIVRSVDELLRTEFGLADGLADTTTWGELAKRHKDLKIPESVSPGQVFVQILDPATGTGTFLVEVIDLIYKTLVANWKSKGHTSGRIETLWNEYVPKHLLPRLHGYELLMAPYAIAHLKIGLKLYETGYGFGSDQRARIYLTNALEPAHDFSGTFEFAIPALAHEAEAVSEVKRSQRFTVVIGNPPYSGVSSNMTDEAQHLVDAYKIVDGVSLNERKLWLQDDYVKFLRLAQLTTERAGCGVLGFITNHGYLDNPTFRGMRQSLLATFPSLAIVDLHGNTNKSEKAPDGSDDKNVFDIRQGVAVCVAARGSLGRGGNVRHCGLWGSRESKYERLLGGGRDVAEWSEVVPSSPFYFLVPRNESGRGEYAAYLSVTDIFATYVSAPVTARDHFVISTSKDDLLERVADLRSNTLTDADARAKYFVGRTRSDKYPPGDSRGWKLPEARERCRQDSDWRSRVITCSYRAFDDRYAYWAEWMIDWPRPDLAADVVGRENICFVTRRQMLPGNISYFLVTSHLPIDGVLRSDNKGGESVFPAFVFENDLLGRSVERRSNVAAQSARRFADCTHLQWSIAPHGDLQRSFGVLDVLGYLYAICFSPTYRLRYEDQIRVDFPRVPLPGGAEVFWGLAKLGARLVDLHVLSDDAVGSADSVQLVGSSRFIESVHWSDQTVWLDRACQSGFRGVEEATWLFHVGAHQVCEKWLKDRKGCTLSKDDVTHYQKIVVAIAETIRLMKEIDEVIEQHGGWPGAFQSRGVGVPEKQVAEPGSGYGSEVHDDPRS